MKHWEKRNTSREKRIHLARGRGGSLYTWERESIIFRKREIRFVKLGHRNRGESLLHVFQEKNVLYGLYSGRTERYSHTADFQSKNRSFGTFPKVYACWFEAVQCTEIKGTAGHVFQGSLLKVEAVQQAVQQHWLLVPFSCLLHIFSVNFSVCSSKKSLCKMHLLSL